MRVGFAHLRGSNPRPGLPGSPSLLVAEAVGLEPTRRFRRRLVRSRHAGLPVPPRFHDQFPRWSGWLAPPQPPPAPKAGALLNELHPVFAAFQARAGRAFICAMLSLLVPPRGIAPRASRVPGECSADLNFGGKDGAARRTCAGLSCLTRAVPRYLGLRSFSWGDRPVPTRHLRVHSAPCRATTPRSP